MTAPSIESYVERVKAHLGTVEAPIARVEFLLQALRTVRARAGRNDFGSAPGGAFLVPGILFDLGELLEHERQQLVLAIPAMPA